MREIKFRAKALEDGSWKTITIRAGAEETMQLLSNYDEKSIVDMNTFSQYTGLKDSESTEIYEGDILESADYGSEEIGKIIYSEDDAMFELEMDGVVLNFSNESSKWWTVIGNIYENPELLGDE